MEARYAGDHTLAILSIIHRQGSVTAKRIMELYEQLTSTTVSVESVHMLIGRLEERGFVEKTKPLPRSVSGVRRTYIYSLTLSGRLHLQTKKKILLDLWFIKKVTK